MDKILASARKKYSEERRVIQKQQLESFKVEGPSVFPETGYMESVQIIQDAPMSPKIHFLTFSNTGYMKPIRILHEALMFQFSTIHAMNEYSIPEFIEKHKDFIETNRHGYGLWIWKPKIIYDKLSSIGDGELLLYCDAGMHLNIKGLQRYYEYIEMMKEHDILTFSLNDEYKAQYYVKRDVIDAYYPEFANQLTPYCYAGVLMLKKTEATMALVKDWLDLCETYRFLDWSKSSAPELEIYEGSDHDNSLLNLCLAKHSISKSIYPDETNVYGHDKHQYLNAPESEWLKMDKYPFQCRRMRPRKD